MTQDGMQFEWRSYVRPFRQPLQTQHGMWRDREGILLKLTAATGRVGYGEIAPVPWFGSEPLAQAVRICQAMPSIISQKEIFNLPDRIPACQFGFESAWEAVTTDFSSCELLSMSGLLPAGDAALVAWDSLWQEGCRTFKWKIAVAALEQELYWFEELCTRLPSEARLRLDANGGLTIEQAKTWLTVCDRRSVEYLEQPLPPNQLAEMFNLQNTFATVIALDESVATLPQLQHVLDRGWAGVVVIKPAIAGSPAKLRHLCQHYPADAVFSSVFETAIGRQAGLRLATELGTGDRAMGYGTTHWFSQDLHHADELWQHL